MLAASQDLGYDKPTKEHTEAANQITGLWEELGVGITPASGSLFATFLAVTRDNVASSSYEKHASHTELSNKEMDAGSSAAWTVVEQFTFSQHWWSCSTQSERWSCSIQLEVELHDHACWDFLQPRWL